jgi:hypothetical protein
MIKYYHMRTIVIVQTLIIIAGAYYIYTLSQAPAPEPEVETIQTDPVVPVTPPPVVEAAPVVVPATTTVSTDPSGHSDVGMEFPIIDEGIDLQSR